MIIINNMIIIGNFDGTVNFYDKNLKLITSQTISKNNKITNFFNFSNFYLLIGCSDNTLCKFELENYTIKRKYGAQQSPINAIYCDNDYLIITGFDNIMNIYKNDKIHKQINLQKKLINNILKINDRFLLVDE